MEGSEDEIKKLMKEDAEASVLAKYGALLATSPESNLEVMALMIEPESKEHFTGVYREISLGNLDNSELNAVRIYLSVASIIAGLYQSNKNVASADELAYIEDLWRFITFRAYTIINTSKSKRGFLAKLLRTTIGEFRKAESPTEKKK